MTNTLNTHARKISSLILNGLIAFFFITSGCSSDDEQGSARSELNTQTPASVSVTSVPVLAEPITPSVEAVLEVEEAEPKVVTYAEAESAFNEKNYASAVDLFTRYTEQKANNPWGFYMLGLSAYRAGDLEVAKAAYNQALELDRGHVKSWINLSRALLAGGETDEAIAALDTALVIDPESRDAYRIKGRVYHNVKQNGEAIASYKQAIIMDETDVWSMNNLALIYIEEQQFDQALPVLALTVQLNDKEALFFNNLGMVLEHHGHMQMAADIYRKAIEIDASNQKALDNLSRVEGVRERTDLEPLDLSALAAKFQADIAEWQGFEAEVGC